MTGGMLGVMGPALLGLLLSGLLARHLPAFCRRRGLVAPVTARSSHATPTPLGGGVLLPLLVVPLGLLTVWWSAPTHSGFLYVLLLASLLVAFIGWRDDHRELDPQLRLAVHLPAVGLALAYLPPLFDILPMTWGVMPWWAEKLILLLAWGWFLNLYNFMDGADGLAASQAVFLGCAIALLVPPLAPLALLVAAVAAGFLTVNWAPAQVFLGDVGATWLGYVLGGLLLLAGADNTWQMIWPLMTVALLFCADATTTLLRRLAQGHKPWEAHKTFWFHRVLALGASHAQLAVGFVVINLLLLALALGFLHLGWPELGFLGGLLLMGACAWYVRAKERDQKQA